MREIKSVLYAFVVDGALVYVGKTRGALKDRLQRYKTPAKNALHGGSTNIKNNKNIRSSLLAGKTVEIYVLPDKHEESYGGFQFSRAAALEDDLIAQFKPAWNGSSRRAVAELEPKPIRPVPAVSTEKKTVRILGGPAEQFRRVLRQLFDNAVASDATHIDVQAGRLHREIGGYPQKGHSMPVCCSVMCQEMRVDDDLLSEPPKGKGATLSIRYRLPR